MLLCSSLKVRTGSVFPSFFVGAPCCNPAQHGPIVLVVAKIFAPLNENFLRVFFLFFSIEKTN